MRTTTRTFVIIFIILAVSLIGSIYALNKHSAQIRKEQAIATYDKQQEQAKQKADNDKENNKSETVSSAAPASDASNELPVTGPELSISNLLGLGLLTTTLLSYLLSRRNLAHSFLTYTSI
jgi:hypothetical protein